ncbi:hypothetical protein HYG86_15185 [Alkalicella caledoniensis]|uniref:DUF3221 domain-containing protein n=1 Tax=Alkalicella caledoniensis TaxID=2731377 RepID=A0A7G9WBF3_ALKCA|nr:hypothetical protein [Alkalicella caledoniensis]QNO16015.1 hypothetical protein HYG86_15185 [Alkalicella caledoniensis]
MGKKMVWLVVIAIVFLATGCGGSVGAQGEDEKVGVRGVITEITHQENGSIIILVEGDFEDDTSYHAGYVRIDSDTTIQRKQDYENLDKGDIEEGIKVEVIFEGDVSESDPVQGKGKILRILD